MIRIDKKGMHFEGPVYILIAEMTALLNKTYRMLQEKFDKETANEIFADMGRIAVMSDDELDERGKELIQMLKMAEEE